MYNPCNACEAKNKLCGQCAFHMLFVNYNEAMKQIVEMAKRIGINASDFM